MVCQVNITVLLEEATLYIPGYECSSPVAPSEFDRFIWGYRLIGGPLLLYLLPQRPGLFRVGVPVADAVYGSRQFCSA